MEHPLIWAVGLGVAYLALSRLSLAFVTEQTGAATWWPASGVALAAFALAPRRSWPWLMAGVFVGNLIAQLLVRDSVTVSALLSVVDALEPVLAGLVLVRVSGRLRADITSVRTVSGITAAAFGANAITAVLGAAVLCIAFGGPPLPTWTAWWLADGVGMLVVAPLLLSLARPFPGPAGRFESVALVGLAAAVAVVLFGHHPSDGPPLLGYALPVVPFLLWCALRLGTRGTTVALLAVTLIASVATAHGLGPFATDALTGVHRAQALQGFVALAVLSTLLIGAVVASQRRAEWRASEEAERLASVLRASDAAIIGADLRGTITHFSEGAERMLGYSASEMLGEDGGRFHDRAEVEARAAELDLEPSFQVFVHAALRGETRDWTWIRADGTRLTVSLAMSAQRDRSGRLTGFLAMGNDVTDRREAQRRLAASEERHRLVLANMPEAQIYLYDRDLVCLLGEGQSVPDDVDESTYVGRHLSELLHADDAAYLLPRFERALAGEPTQTTYVSPRTGRHHDVHLLPHRGAAGEPDGEPDGVLVVMRDITERRRQEQAVRRAEADLRTIFEEAPIGNAVFDARLRLVDANAALSAITGYARDEAPNVPIEAVVTPHDAATVLDLLRRVSRGEQRDAETDIVLRHADGHLVDVSLSIVGLGVDGDSDGSRRRTLVQVVDVSERKRFEERLRVLAETDSLSGLLNRRRFDIELAAHLDRGRRYGSSGAVVLVDVDAFKQVNDTRGHAAGDEVIVAVARTLAARLRSSDVLARLGGDEFAILLPSGGADEAAAVADGLVDAVRRETDVTISVGVAPVERTTPLTADQLLRDADTAMYAAKAAGRDRHALFGQAAPNITAGAASAEPPSHPTS